MVNLTGHVCYHRGLLGQLKQVEGKNKIPALTISIKLFRVLMIKMENFGFHSPNPHGNWENQSLTEFSKYLLDIWLQHPQLSSSKLEN